MPRASTANIDELAASDSVELFLAHVGFGLTNDNAEAVMAICRATDGLPLALELAGARASIEGLDVVDPTSGRPVTSVASAIARADAIDDALRRTLSLLSAEEARYFSRLSVFTGPFSREMGSACRRRVVGRSMLERLVRTALVQRLGEVGRYRLWSPRAGSHNLSSMTTSELPQDGRTLG